MDPDWGIHEEESMEAVEGTAPYMFEPLKKRGRGSVSDEASENVGLHRGRVSDPRPRSPETFSAEPGDIDVSNWQVLLCFSVFSIVNRKFSLCFASSE